VRVCLDTNVLVAAFATRGLCADVLRTVIAEHELVLAVRDASPVPILDPRAFWDLLRAGHAG
jgi:hypothetical protein